jgi:hypothetical protein
MRYEMGDMRWEIERAELIKRFELRSKIKIAGPCDSMTKLR